MKIETRRKRIEKKISDLTKLLFELEQECHANGHGGKLVGVYRANTGNWSTSDDRYWVDFRCPLCDMRWHEDQGDLPRCPRRLTKDGIPFTKVDSFINVRISNAT